MCLYLVITHSILECLLINKVINDTIILPSCNIGRKSHDPNKWPLFF